MTNTDHERTLRRASPALEAILTSASPPPALFSRDDVRCETLWVSMRDGIRLASDVYLPPELPAPVLLARTPYGRARRAAVCMTFAQFGYVVVSQDCRGTGDSEPDEWEYYVFEPEDSVDTVDWIIRQRWCDGFVAGFGGSYAASTQWCMAMHAKTAAIAPEVGGLGVIFETARLYMFLNAYVRTVGKGEGTLQLSLEELEHQLLPETLAGGYYNEPLHFGSSPTSLSARPANTAARRRHWKRFCDLPPHQRSKLLKRAFSVPRFTYVEMEQLCAGYGLGVAFGAHSIPSSSPEELRQRISAPALLITGWYDWNLNDVLRSWQLLSSSTLDSVRLNSRLLVTPSSHNSIGYKEGRETNPELDWIFRTPRLVELLMHWYSSVRTDQTDSWPRVIYYLMGANEWHTAQTWPPCDARLESLYLHGHGALSTELPPDQSPADHYTYDPSDPTPTCGGSIVSHVYVPGSVDVSAVQRRRDVLTYTTPPLIRALDVVGYLRLILHASSTACDTDFSARLTDVFPDGRSIQLQSGMLRTRYRDLEKGSQPLEPGEIYRFEIDMWAIANRFEVGHRLRLDICSADFPRYDRNSNTGGTSILPIPAVQSIYHQSELPSQLVISVLSPQAFWEHFSSDPTELR